MAESNNSKNVFSADDPLDINELASLNDDISPEFIEQLQNQVAQNASQFTGKTLKEIKDDAELFEEIPEKTHKTKFEDSIDDNFIKKYKAKLNKQEALMGKSETEAEEKTETKTEIKAEAKVEVKAEVKAEVKVEQSAENNTLQNSKNIPEKTSLSTKESSEEIKELTSGNIIEKPVEQEQITYNESLDFLDDNVKYSKYVVYIDPENTDFMESLTVKERKNLINRILREQDDVALTKRRLRLVQAIIKHAIVAIVTIAIAIPVVYWTINASLEASINNYRRSQTIFKTLYKEKGKIKHKNY